MPSQKVCIIYKDCFYIDSNFKEFKDNFNLLKLVNKLKAVLLLWLIYLTPGENHKNLIENLIEKITKSKSIYGTKNTILFGNINNKRDEIEKIMKLIKIL